jgi:hypothetical protein
LAQHTRGVNIMPSLAVTCLDQVDDHALISYNVEGIVSTSKDRLLRLLTERLRPNTLYTSEGPTRSTIVSKLST